MDTDRHRFPAAFLTAVASKADPLVCIPTWANAFVHLPCSSHMQLTAVQLRSTNSPHFTPLLLGKSWGSIQMTT